MEFIQFIIDFILHIDVHLAQLVAEYGTWVYVILFVIVFCETGLVVTPFLPGDSLLFMAGALAALPDSSIQVPVMAGILIIAAIGGDGVNYTIGKFFGEKLFRNPDSKIFKQKYLIKTQNFYAKYGGKTIFLARFVPIVRTFAPFVAGMGKMSYRRFGVFNVVGGICWVSLFSFAGYFFGNLPFVQSNLKLIVVAIIIISIMPAVIEIIREKKKKRKRMKRIFVFFMLLVLYPIIVKSEILADKNKSFDYSFFNYCDWFRPFWSDMHSTITSTELAVAFTTAEYAYHAPEDNSIDSVAKTYSFSNLGADLPLFNCSFANEKYKLGLTLPFFIEAWVDYFEETTSPIINTAYRMGAPEIIFLHQFDKPLLGFINNYSIKISPFKHESTHLGDELTLYRINKEMPITRVNVSYNYSEYGLTINDPAGSMESNHSFRFSFMRLISDGWYDISSFEGDIDLVEYSTRNYEWYAQYQYQTPVFSNLHLQGIFSAEYRYRVKYNYPYYFLDYIPDTPEWDVVKDIYSKLNLNFAVGIRYNNPSVMKDYKVGLAVKFYNGINPYGQFRSIPFFSKAGLCIMFER